MNSPIHDHLMFSTGHNDGLSTQPGDLDIGFGQFTFKRGHTGNLGDLLILQVTDELHRFLCKQMYKSAALLQYTRA